MTLCDTQANRVHWCAKVSLFLSLSSFSQPTKTLLSLSKKMGPTLENLEAAFPCPSSAWPNLFPHLRTNSHSIKGLTLFIPSKNFQSYHIPQGLACAFVCSFFTKHQPKPYTQTFLILIFLFIYSRFLLINYIKHHGNPTIQ